MRRFDDFNPGLLFIYYMAAIVPFMVIMDPLLSAAALLTGLIRVGIMNGSSLPDVLVFL